MKIGIGDYVRHHAIISNFFKLTFVISVLFTIDVDSFQKCLKLRREST